MATRTISAAVGTRNYNDTATWDEGVVPTAADDVVARGDGTSGNLIMNTTGLLARSIDFTNYTGTWTWSAGATCSLGTSLKCVPGMSTSVAASTLNFISTVTGNTITTAGKNMPAFNFNGTGGAWTLLDNVTFPNSQAFTVTRGTVDATGRTLTVGTITASGTLTRALNLTNATVNAFTTGTPLTLASTGLTLTTTGCTYNITDASGNTKTIATGGVSCAGMTVNFTVAGTGGLIITGAGTFAAVNVTSHKLTLPASTTTTLTSSLRMRGPAASLVSSTSGTAATLSAGGGVTIDVEAVSIQDVTASGGATFAAVNSANVSGNTGWTFKRLARGWGVAV